MRPGHSPQRALHTLLATAGLHASRAFAIALVLAVGAAGAQEDSTMKPIPDRWPAVADPEQRSADQLLLDATARRSEGHLSQAVLLAYLALKDAEAGEGDVFASAAARSHLLLSEMMGEFGYRAMERIHAEKAYQALLRANSSGRDLSPGPFHARLGAVAMHTGDYAVAEHYYQLAVADAEAAELPNLEQKVRALLDKVVLSLEWADLDSVLDPSGLQHLQSAGEVLDQAVSLASDIEEADELHRRISELQAEMLIKASDQLPPEHEEHRVKLLATAEHGLRIVLEQLDEEYGKNSDRQLRALNSLLSIHMRQGRYVEASDVSQRMLDITDRRQRGDPRIALNLMMFSTHLKNFDTTIKLCGIIMSGEEARVAELAHLNGEAVALAASGQIRKWSMKCLSLLSAPAAENGLSARQMLDLVLRRKAVIADAEGAFWRDLYSQGSARFSGARDKLLGLRNRLSVQVVSGEGEGLWNLIRDIEQGEVFLSIQPQFIELRESADQEAQREALSSYAKKVLGGESPWDAITASGPAFEASTVGIDEVAARLPEGSALVEFARVEDFDSDRDVFLQTARYWALLLSKDGMVRAFDLGDAAQLESLVEEQIGVVQTTHKLDAKPQLQAMSLLYDAVWSQFASDLDGTDTIFVSPDGVLGVVPFAALLDPEGKFLIEKKTLYQLSSGRELVSPPQREAAGLGAPAIVWDPDYDLGSPEEQPAHAGEAGATSPARMKFARLAGSAREAEIIRAILGEDVTPLDREKATESAVRVLSRPRVLHLATHGIFHQDMPVKLEGLRAEDRLALDAAYARHVRTLSRSGIALAGINAGATVGETDGFLTAYDVIGMDLTGTDLVVLSACETGRGSLLAGEGVLGLGRSFRVAGARYVVVSLWLLSGAEATRQMRAFYKSYAAGTNPVIGLRDVHRKQIKRYREVFGGAPPPALWGALTVQGGLG